MPKHPLLPILPIFFALAGCQTMDERPSERLGQAVMQSADGSPAGTARLIGNAGRVDISIALQGVQPGEHRLILNAMGACTPQDFRAAGTAADAAGAEELPRAIVNNSGSATVSATLAGAGEEVMARLFDTDGSAIVLLDGIAGDTRIACGIFTRN